MEREMADQQQDAGRSGRRAENTQETRLVAIRYDGRRIGLYRVRQVGESGVRLNHGGISFPVGTRLEVEDIQHLFPKSFAPQRAATVVGNTARGLVLAWHHANAGDRQ